MCYHPKQLERSWRITLFDFSSHFNTNVTQLYGCVCVYSSDILGIKCQFSVGRFPRHVELKDIVKRILVSAQIPSRLESV